MKWKSEIGAQESEKQLDRENGAIRDMQMKNKKWQRELGRKKIGKRENGRTQALIRLESYGGEVGWGRGYTAMSRAVIWRINLDTFLMAFHRHLNRMCSPQERKLLFTPLKAVWIDLLANLHLWWIQFYSLWSGTWDLPTPAEGLQHTDRAERFSHVTSRLDPVALYKKQRTCKR